MTSRKKTPANSKLLGELRTALREDPHFIHSVKTVIDEISGEMPDKILFDWLKPRVSLPWPVSYGTRPTVSPDSVDLFFYPWVRRKLQAWQATYLDQSVNKLDRDRAKDKIELVFRRFLFQGSGPKGSLSGSEISEIFRDRYKILKICEAIIQDSLYADTAGRTKYQYRKDQIINRFDWCAGDLGKNHAFAKRSENTASRRNAGIGTCNQIQLLAKNHQDNHQRKRRRLPRV